VRGCIHRRWRARGGAGVARGPRSVPRHRDIGFAAHPGHRNGRCSCANRTRRSADRRGHGAAGEPMTGLTASTDASTGPLLEVRDLNVHHGQLQALHGVSLTVPAGAVHAMIGANGAGKSTLLRTIAGLHKLTSGSILLDEADITALRP